MLTIFPESIRELLPKLEFQEIASSSDIHFFLSKKGLNENSLLIVRDDLIPQVCEILLIEKFEVIVVEPELGLPKLSAQVQLQSLDSVLSRIQDDVEQGMETKSEHDVDDTANISDTES